MHVNPESAILEHDVPSETTTEVPAPVDAIIQISIADKGLVACLKIEPPVNGGAPPTYHALFAVLSANHITYNVDYDKLKSLAENPIYNEDILIASGIAPVDGDNGTVSFLIKTEKTGFSPKKGDDGRVDYRELDIVENVRAGQTLCTITLPTEGSAGKSVQGKELLQRKGRPVPSHLGRNTQLNEDGTAILSKINGQLDFVGNKINVDETFHIKGNVDNSTGNIHVAGNLVISGMVMPGFVIEAAGNIEISGAVEQSIFKAGGNIKLQSGINGGELHCCGDLKCKYIQNCVVFTRGDIFAESIINSNVRCGKNIKVGGTIAKIIGGNCVAGQNIEANSIGSLSNIKTKLQLGLDQVGMERQQELQAQVPQWEMQNEKLIPLLDILMQLEGSNRLNPEKKKILEDVRFSYESNLNLLEVAKIELEEIALSIKARGFGRIVGLDTIHPGTTVVIGDSVFTISDTIKNASLYYKQGEICVGSAR